MKEVKQKRDEITKLVGVLLSIILCFVGCEVVDPHYIIISSVDGGRTGQITIEMESQILSHSMDKKHVTQTIEGTLILPNHIQTSWVCTYLEHKMNVGTIAIAKQMHYKLQGECINNFQISLELKIPTEQDYYYKNYVLTATNKIEGILTWEGTLKFNGDPLHIIDAVDIMFPLIFANFSKTVSKQTYTLYEE